MTKYSSIECAVNIPFVVRRCLAPRRAGLVLDKRRKRFSWLELIWADDGYNAWQVEATIAKLPLLRMEIVKRSDETRGFVVLRHRWESSAPFPGSDETGVSSRISRTLPKTWPALLSSPPSSWPLGGLPGREHQNSRLAINDEQGPVSAGAKIPH
jgi:hypothetical protein